MDQKSNERKPWLKTAGLVLGCATALCVAGVVGWAAAHQPEEGKHNYRATHRKDGRRKIVFDTAFRANIQCVVQLLVYHEKCNSYWEPAPGNQDKVIYLTGHKHIY